MLASAPSRSPLWFVAIPAVGALAFLAVRHAGLELVAPAPAPGAPGFGSGVVAHGTTLFHVLLLLAVVMVLARVLGALVQRLGQPPVIGEILAGIVLGPSILGRLAPELSASLIPAGITPQLAVLAQVGVILFMFLVGLELDTGLVRRRVQATVMVSHASIVLPFGLGAAAALWLYPRYSSADVPFTTFALFMGVSMAITAFPVLARILKDRGLQSTPLGVMALTCAAIDDVTAWCLLAFVAAVAQAEASAALVTLGLTAAFVAAMVLVVRPLVRALMARDVITPRSTALVLVGVVLSALATELIGIHALFGAFALGAAIPHDSPLAHELRNKIEDVVLVLFLPAFFALTGMRTELGLLDSGADWLVCGAIIVLATAGKLGGSTAAARFAGLPWRESLSIGVLMNTRGLVELVVLNVGLDLRVISPTVFTMMVMMALVTTAMTSPLLSRSLSTAR